MSDTFRLELNEIRTGIQKFGYKGVKDLNDRGQLMIQGGGSLREGKPHDIHRVK